MKCGRLEVAMTQ